MARAARALCLLASSCSLLDLSALDGAGASDGALSPEARASSAAESAVSTSASIASTASTVEASTTASATTSGEYRDVVLADAPTVYLRFEGAGPELFDEVSRSIVGEAVDQVSFGVPGAFEPRSGTGIQLHDGHLILDDDVPVAWQGVEPYTVELWFNPHEDLIQPQIYPRLFTRETFGPRDGIVIALTIDEAAATTCRVVWERFAADVQDQVAAPDVPTIGFTYLVGTFDGATMRLFVNGVEVGSRATTTSLAVSSPVHLGAVPGAASTQLKANLDEVALYAFALEPERIAAHYAARLP